MSLNDSSSHFALSVKALVRDNIGKVLILRRSLSSKANPDRWDFPGGKIDLGEGFDAALVREIREETGITVNLVKPVAHGSSQVIDRQVVYLFMEARHITGVVTLSDEHSEFRWVSLRELADIAAAGGQLCPQFQAIAADYCAVNGYGATPPTASETGSRSASHVDQHVAEFTALLPHYSHLRTTIEAILKEATRDICPLAFVQTRVKDPVHLAEKILRKAKYVDPLREITDLCGARVITQTLSEVDAICEFIRDRFLIDEKNSLDTRTRLSAREFAYRSVHYIVSLRPDDPAASPDIHGLKAEIQVRTIVQHAWADIGHDRLYKAGFSVPDVWQREAARIAALLENADDSFTRLVDGVEHYRSQYGAYLNQEEMQREIDTARAVLRHAPQDQGLASRLSRLLLAQGSPQGVVELVNQFPEPNVELSTCFGIALTALNARQLQSDEFIRGREFLQRACRLAPDNAEPWVKLAETAASPHEQLDLYGKAYRANPTDPYALVGYVRQRIVVDRNASFIALLRPSIEAAMRRCQDQVEVNVDVPFSLYCIAAFNLLLGPECERDCLDALCRAVKITHNPQMVANALAAATSLHEVEPHRPDLARVIRFLTTVRAARWPNEESLQAVRAFATKSSPPITSPVAIVAGGCDVKIRRDLQGYRDLLQLSFEGYAGSVISGGTREGISGLVAQLTGDHIRTVGYLPATLPSDGSATPDPRFSELRLTDGQGAFSVAEPIQAWIDILASGIDPGSVRLLGVNGGDIAAMEYRLAWALGARVAVVRDSGREADILANEAQALGFEGLLVVPADPPTVRTFLANTNSDMLAVSSEDLERLARQAHAQFLSETHHPPPDPAMKAWDDLPAGFKRSNLEQVSHMVANLAAVGLAVRSCGGPVPELELRADEVERLAELEHGRWIVERLQAGWQYGPHRDPDRKTSPYLVGWSDLDALDPKAKEWDRRTVRRFPALLAEAGFEIQRQPPA